MERKKVLSTPVKKSRNTPVMERKKPRTFASGYAAAATTANIRSTTALRNNTKAIRTTFTRFKQVKTASGSSSGGIWVGSSVREHPISEEPESRSSDKIDERQDVEDSTVASREGKAAVVERGYPTAEQEIGRVKGREEYTNDFSAEDDSDIQAGSYSRQVAWPFDLTSNHGSIIDRPPLSTRAVDDNHDDVESTLSTQTMLAADGNGHEPIHTSPTTTSNTSHSNPLSSDLRLPQQLRRSAPRSLSIQRWADEHQGQGHQAHQGHQGHHGNHGNHGSTQQHPTHPAHHQPPLQPQSNNTLIRSVIPISLLPRTICGTYKLACVVTATASLSVSIGYSALAHDTSGGFTIGAFIVALASMIIIPLQSRHWHRCRCETVADGDGDGADNGIELADFRRRDGLEER